MTAQYLIKLMEEFCNRHNLDIAKEYQLFADVYQETYGMNIILKMKEAGYDGMPEYLESLSIVERYVEILNGQENKFKKGWR